MQVRALNLATFIASSTAEKLKHCQMFRASQGGPRTPKGTADAILDYVFVYNTLDFFVLESEGPDPLLEPLLLVYPLFSV